MKIKRLFKTTFIALLLLLIPFIFACNEEVEVESITINGNDNLFIGDTIKLEAIVLPDNATNKEVIWSSDNPSIASVDLDGKVTGISVGKTIINATAGGITMEHEVEVKEELKQDYEMFSSVEVVTVDAIVGEKVELKLTEKNKGDIKENHNPYDYDDINIYAVFTSQNNQTIKMPAFWYRDYEITLTKTNINPNGISGHASTNSNEPQGLEQVKWLADPEYRIRFAPTEAGKWTYKVYVYMNNSPVQILNGEVDVSLSDTVYKGVLEVDSTQNRNFKFKYGQTFIPIGLNLGWYTSSTRKTYDYDVWMENMKENNMNYARIWMSTWGFCLHWGNKYNDYTDCMNNASRLDRTLEVANENGIYVMLTLINHGQFSSSVNPLWNQNPYNKANGGILNRAQDFFTDQEAKKAYKNELLYIIARYGYSDNIMAWELFNEVGWVDGFNAYGHHIKLWHQEMARFIKENDPYNHMITTSYTYDTGAAYSLEEIAFTNPHSYDYANKNMNTTVPQAMDKVYNTYNKPVMYGEIGINWEDGSACARLDPNGISLRQAAWSGMMGGSAGSAMHWWWDSWIHPNDLYYQYKGAGAFAMMMNMSDSSYQQLRLDSSLKVSSDIGLLGYKFDNRIYGYVYNNRWTYYKEVSDLSNQTIEIDFNEGNYTITFYSALTGEVIGFNNITSNGKVKITLPTFNADIAFIIK